MNKIPLLNSQPLSSLFPLSSVLGYAEPVQAIHLPLCLSKIAAGFPSPAEDHVEKELSPNDYLVENKTATFFMRMQGNALADIGIFDKDVLVVDRSRTARTDDIVVAIFDGDFLARILGRMPNGYPCLMPANRQCEIMEAHAESQFEIWGVVVGMMRRYK